MPTNVSTMRARRWWLTAAVALIAIAVAVAASTGSTHASGTTGDEIGVKTVSPFPAAVAADRNAAAHDGFGAAFATLRGAGAALPAESVVQDPGVDRSAAHEITPVASEAAAKAGAAAPKARLWAAPRYDATECLLAQPADAQGPAQLCATLEQAIGGYLFMTQSASASDVELYGLMPDGFGSVSVTFGDGSSIRLPVVENVYAARFEKPTAALSFVDAAGMEHTLTALSAG